MVTSNRMGEDWRRPQLDEGLLELHLMRAAHFTGRARAGLELLSGNWREGGTIESIAADKIEIASERPRIWVAVDGELRREETPLVFSIAPHKVPVLLPKM
jgi:diacylglycerol kinase family enzyme